MEVSLLLALGAVSFAAAVNDSSAPYPGAFPSPPGVMPNLEDPKDAGRVANIVGVVICDVLVTVLFATRVWVKLRITRNILLEDMVKHGEGHHSWDISPQDYSQMLKWLYASSTIYCPTAYFTKVTLLLLIARVFAVEERASRALHIFIVALLIAYLPIQGVKIAICTPIRSYWDPNVDGRCLEQPKIFIADLCLAIITDLVILIVPIPLTWRLGMSWKRKLKIVFLLGAGGVATATTIYRLYKVVEFQKSTDVASDFVLQDLLTMIELTIGVMCACLPAANILYEHHSGNHPARPSGNSPRSGRNLGNGRLAWRGLGTTADRHLNSSSTGISPTGAVDEETLAMSEVTGTKETPSNFDLELAMLSRRSGSHDSLSNRNDGVISRPEPMRAPHWLAIERADSNEGRREGWLSPKKHHSQRRFHGEAGKESGSAESRTSEISLELARVSGNRPWTRIWDGRSNSAHQLKSKDLQA